MELRFLFHAARRSAALVLIVTSVCAVLGFATWCLLPTTYQASTVLVLDSTSVTYPGQAPFAGDPERYISGELEALRSYPVIARAAGTLDPAPSVDALRSAIDLTHVTGSDVVQVTAHAGTARRAIAMANAVATAYVDRRGDLAKAVLDGQRAALDKQAAQIGDRLANEHLVDAESRALEATLAQINTSLGNLAQPGVLHDATQVVDTARAAVPTRAASLPVAVLASALVGMFAALAAGSVRALRDRRVIGREEIEALARRPVAALFPHLRHAAKAAPEEVLDRWDAALGRIAALTGPDGQQPARPLVITCCSAAATSGCSTVAAALALRLAGDGLRVAMVVAERGNSSLALAPSVAEHVTPRAGSSRRAATTDIGWQSADGVVPRLTVTSRTDGARPTSEDFAKALAEAPGADVVVVDASSVLDSSFATAAVLQSDRIVLVVPSMDQSESDLRLALELLDSTEAVARVVLTHP